VAMMPLQYIVLRSKQAWVWTGEILLNNYRRGLNAEMKEIVEKIGLKMFE
jgi:hypothetical protein